MFSYRKMLLQTLRITLKNKYLWFFGLFASLLSIGAEYQILTRAMSRSASWNWLYSWERFLNSGLFSQEFFSRIFDSFGRSPFLMSLVLAIGLIIVAAFLLLIWLAVVSQIALVNNSYQIIKSKKDIADSSLHSGILAGAKNFWSVLWLNLVSKIIINILVVLVSLPLIFVIWNRTFSAIIYIILFILLIPLAVGLSLLIKYAIAFVVLKNKKFKVALKSAWTLFMQNWIISLEMSFVLFAISFVATFVILTLSLVLALPFFFLAMILLSAFTSLAFWSAVILGVIIVTIFIIFCGSILSTFQAAAWTNLFNHLGRGVESRIERWTPENVKTATINFK
ncbi:MAG: hypothetical protein WC564_04780 [Patescibacteria group bacterium]